MIAALCSLGILTAGILAAVGLPCSSTNVQPEPKAAPNASEQEKRPHIRATLLNQHHTVTPNSTAWIGLELDIDKDWHTYWPGRNETGTPPAVKWNLPAGYKVGEFLWPAPKRYVQGGDTLDHVYEGRVLLMAPLEVPASAKPGEKVQIKAACTFVVCQDVCLMEKASPTLTLIVSDGWSSSTVPPHAKRFTEARERVPVPLKDAKGVSAKVENGKLLVEAKGAAKVMFYPYEDSVATPALLKEGEVKGERLTLTLQPEDAPARIRGVVEAQGGALKQPVFVDVDLEVPRS